MKKYISLFLLLASTLTGAAVQAQPCYAAQQQCYDAPCCPSDECCDDSGVYLSAFGGANWLNRYKKHGITITNDVGYTGGAALGYRFNRNFRAEAEVAYRNNHVDSVKFFGIKDHPKAHMDSISVMANGYYDFDLSTCFTPYVGVGIGYAHVKGHAAHPNMSDVTISSSDDRFAAQAIVGVSKRIFKNTDLGLEYRYFIAKTDYQTQSVNLSLRYAF